MQGLGLTLVHFALSTVQRLESFDSIPDYPGYLVHILTHLTNEDERFRSVAGLLLKNNLAALSTANNPAMLAYVKESVLSALGDPIAMVRGTVGTVIVSLLNNQGIESWTEALAKLMGGLDSPNNDEQEVCPAVEECVQVGSILLTFPPGCSRPLREPSRRSRKCARTCQRSSTSRSLASGCSTS